MKSHRFIVLAFVAQLCMAPLTALAHPGSGIVVDAQGNVYFTHTGRGVAKLDPQGRLTYVGNTGGGHWLCLDADGSFSRTQIVIDVERALNAIENEPGFKEKFMLYAPDSLPSLINHFSRYGCVVAVRIFEKINEEGREEQLRIDKILYGGKHSK
jgi:hypothetical protein